MQDSELPVKTEIVEDSMTGKGIWIGDVTWLLYERELVTGSIS